MGTAGRDLERERDDEQRHEDHQRRCRICAGDVAKNCGVHIFAEEGRRHYLQANIRKYLYILVSSEDKYPKMVCFSCLNKLGNIHRFAMMALRTQEKLRLKLYGASENDRSFDVDSTQDIDEEELKEIHDEKMEDRGLLHSILTKGAIEILSEGEPLGPSEILLKEDQRLRTPSMEEMEVKLDPMIFLQCALDQPSSDHSDFSEEEYDEDDDEEERIKEISTTEPLPLTNKFVQIKEEEGSKKIKELQPSEESNSEDNMNGHAKSHECTICARSFVSQIGLQNHLWSHLPIRDKQLIDDKAVLRPQKVYSSNGVLQVNSDNNASGNFVCPICSKRISTKGNLKVHLETHRPKGKYGCDICGRIFKTQSNLFRHKEYHGGIQFPCNVCGRVYPTNSTLRAHSITHSDLRPHACPLCDKTFKRNQDLKFHINQHTGARPYQCPYCPKAFASSGNCFSHRKRMHPREVHRDRQRAADLMR